LPLTALLADKVSAYALLDRENLVDQVAEVLWRQDACGTSGRSSGQASVACFLGYAL